MPAVLHDGEHRDGGCQGQQQWTEAAPATAGVAELHDVTGTVLPAVTRKNRCHAFIMIGAARGG